MSIKQELQEYLAGRAGWQGFAYRWKSGGAPAASICLGSRLSARVRIYTKWRSRREIRPMESTIEQTVDLIERQVDQEEAEEFITKVPGLRENLVRIAPGPQEVGPPQTVFTVGDDGLEMRDGVWYVKPRPGQFWEPTPVIGVANPSPALLSVLEESHALV